MRTYDVQLPCGYRYHMHPCIYSAVTPAPRMGGAAESGLGRADDRRAAAARAAVAAVVLVANASPLPLPLPKKALLPLAGAEPVDPRREEEEEEGGRGWRAELLVIAV